MYVFLTSPMFSSNISIESIFSEAPCDIRNHFPTLDSSETLPQPKLLDHATPFRISNGVLPDSPRFDPIERNYAESSALGNCLELVERDDFF
jgi:hypothetical protein